MDVSEEFREEVALGGAAALDRLALLIAAQGAGPLDVSREQARLDELATDFGGGTAAELMGWLRIRGFRGNGDSYYDPDNSFLNRVLDPVWHSDQPERARDRVGRRCGIHLVGIGLPDYRRQRRTRPVPQPVPAPVDVAGAGHRTPPAVRWPGGPAHARHGPTGRGMSIAARCCEPGPHLRPRPGPPISNGCWFQTSSGAAPAVRRQLVATLRSRPVLEASELAALVADPLAPATPDEREADETLLTQLRGNLN